MPKFTYNMHCMVPPCCAVSSGSLFPTHCPLLNQIKKSIKGKNFEKLKKFLSLAYYIFIHCIVQNVTINKSIMVQVQIIKGHVHNVNKLNRYICETLTSFFTFYKLCQTPLFVNDDVFMSSIMIIYHSIYFSIGKLFKFYI